MQKRQVASRSQLPSGPSAIRRSEDNAACWEVREQVRQAIQVGLQFLLKERKTAPGRDLFSRLLGTERATEGGRDG
jgi:hypothetical protein